MDYIFGLVIIKMVVQIRHLKAKFSQRVLQCETVDGSGSPIGRGFGTDPPDLGLRRSFLVTGFARTRGPTGGIPIWDLPHGAFGISWKEIKTFTLKSYLFLCSFAPKILFVFYPFPTTTSYLKLPFSVTVLKWSLKILNSRKIDWTKQ